MAKENLPGFLSPALFPAKLPLQSRIRGTSRLFFKPSPPHISCYTLNVSALTNRIVAANKFLAPYAVPHQGLLGRVKAEPEDETRSPFQRDRDRIIHTQAFRRLQGKTQVFVIGEGDHYRTRLTHTLEVAQISRDIARTLRLNEDLAECIALAHDLGHPPFGHAGEQALDKWMHDHGSSFEHNRQSLRNVTTLEEHSSLIAGLNLNNEILEGMQKHRTPHDQSTASDHAHDDHRDHAQHRSLSLEAQVVNLADEIAYTGHDVDDGLRAKLFTNKDLDGNVLSASALQRCSERGTSVRGGIIHLLVMDLYAATQKSIEKNTIKSLDDVYRASELIVCFSSTMQKELDALRAFLWQRMYLAPAVQSANDEGKKIVLDLCEHLLKHPIEKVLALQKSHGGELVEAIKDYVSGMTDQFAASSLLNMGGK